MADRRTTTCALARSLARNVNAYWNAHGAYDQRPSRAGGYSPKTGRTYTFRTADEQRYLGRAGDATLRVFIAWD